MTLLLTALHNLPTRITELYNNYIITKPAEHACSRFKESACMTAAKFSPPWAWAELFKKKKNREFKITKLKQCAAQTPQLTQPDDRLGTSRLKRGAFTV